MEVFMDICIFNSYKDLLFYRMELVGNIYEMEKFIQKKKEDILLEYDFLERTDRIKYGDDSHSWEKSKNGYVGEWERSFKDNIGFYDLKGALDEVNLVLYEMEQMRFLSNRECLRILLNVLNRDNLGYEIKFYDVGNETLVCLVSGDIGKEHYILYDRCSKIQDKRSYLDKECFLFYDYYGMNEEEMEKVNHYMFSQYKKNRNLLKCKKERK